MLSIAPRGLFLTWSTRDELSLYRELTSCQKKRAIKHPITKHQLELVFVQLFGEKDPHLVELDIFKSAVMTMSAGLNAQAARLGQTQAALVFQLCYIPRYWDILLFNLYFHSVHGARVTSRQDFQRKTM